MRFTDKEEALWYLFTQKLPPTLREFVNILDKETYIRLHNIVRDEFRNRCEVTILPSVEALVSQASNVSEMLEKLDRNLALWIYTRYQIEKYGQKF
jgi:hypothetical protein